MDKNIIHVYEKEFEDHFSVIISLSYKCNQSCVYCDWHRDEEFREYEYYIKLMETIINSVKKKVVFYIHGGEPTIIPDLYKMVKYLSLKYNTSFNIQTNTSKSLSWFNQFKDLSNNVIFTCSYQHHQNKTSFDLYLEKVEWLYHNDLLHAVDFILEPMDEIGVIENIKKINNSCLSSKTLYTYVDMIVNDKYDDVLDIIDNSGKDLKVVCVEYKDGTIKQYYNTLDIKMMNNDCFRLFHCYAGKTQIYVEPNGDVYKCITDRYTNTPRLNVLDGDLLSDYISNGPYICLFKKCICELWVEKVRVGYND